MNFTVPPHTAFTARFISGSSSQGVGFIFVIRGWLCSGVIHLLPVAAQLRECIAIWYHADTTVAWAGNESNDDDSDDWDDDDDFEYSGDSEPEGKSEAAINEIKETK